MDSADDGVSSGKRHRTHWLSFLLLALAITLGAAIIVLRRMAPNMDYGVVNIMTLIVGFFGWVATILAAVFARLPNWTWVSLLGLPLVAIGGLFSLFQFERVDSELVPHFRARWTESAELPTAPQIQLELQVDSSKLDPRPTDYPQFLGLNRNATITGLTLETNWTNNPPTIAWRQPIGAGWSGFSVQGDMAVTLEQREMKECVSAYDIADGKPLWMHAVESLHTNPLGGLGPRSTPTLHGGHAFAHLATGKLLCLELASGKLVWEVNLLELAGSNQTEAEVAVSWGRSGSPLIVGDTLVVPFGGAKQRVAASLIALRLDNGREIWRAGEDQISYSSPTLVSLRGQNQILSVNENTMSSHDPESGKQLWSVDWPGGSDGPATASQPVPLDDSRVLVSKAYGTGSKVIEVSKSQDGSWSATELWSDASLLKTKFTSCVLKDNFVYGLSDGILECVDSRNGLRQWKQGRYRHGHVLLVGDVLLVTSEAGELVLVEAKPEEFCELASMQVIGDVTWNTPALSGNRLLMRNADEAACVLLPMREMKAPN